MGPGKVFFSGYSTTAQIWKSTLDPHQKNIVSGCSNTMIYKTCPIGLDHELNVVNSNHISVEPLTTLKI